MFSDVFCWGLIPELVLSPWAVLEVRLISLLELNMERLF